MSLSQMLNKRVTIQSSVLTQDAAGQPVLAWTDVATVWASVIDISGREYVAASAVRNDAETRITIRHRAGVVPAMRVLHGTIAYNVESVLGQDNRSLLLMCSRAA